MRCAMLSLTLLLVVPAAHAQRLAVPDFSDLPTTPRASDPPAVVVPVQQTSPALLAFGGILAGTVGAFAGGIAGPGSRTRVKTARSWVWCTASLPAEARHCRWAYTWRTTAVGITGSRCSPP